MTLLSRRQNLFSVILAKILRPARYKVGNNREEIGQ